MRVFNTSRRRVFFAAVVGLQACGSDGPVTPPPPPPPPPPAPVATVTVAVPSPAVAGNTAQAAATLRDAQGGVLTGRQIQWSTSDPLIATIDLAGLVTTVYPGSVNITAQSEGKSGSAALTVELDPALTAARGHLSAGEAGGCGIRPSGAAACWGRNDWGQLGDGTTNGSQVPVTVAGGRVYQAITVGVGFACGLTTAGQAFCWGVNSSGALGDGSTNHSSVPVAVAGGRTWISLAAGVISTCGVATGGAAYCWGTGEALGDGVGANSSVPVAVAGGHQFTAVTVANGDEAAFACGLTVAGTAYCWGSNFNGLGNAGAPAQNSLTPLLVSGGHSFQAIGASDAHACGLTTIGDVYCWGWNHRGQLGDGTTTDRTTPVKVGGGQRFALLSVGEYLNCGLSVTGAAFCWGDNRDGQLGTGSVSEFSATPVAVTGGHRFAVTAQGWNFACGVTVAGQGRCWGSGSGGRLGNGTTTNSSVPVPITGWP